MLPGYSGGRLPGRSTREGGREEEKAEEDSRERRIRNEIAQEVVPGIKEKASAHEDVKSTAQRTAGQSVKQSWDCSQIENEEEEENDWHKENQMEVQWAEDEKLEESLERRAEGVSLQAKVLQKVPAKCKSDDQECGRQCWALALDHEARSVERRSTDLVERRRGRQAVGTVEMKRRKMCRTQAMLRKRAEHGGQSLEK